MMIAETYMDHLARAAGKPLAELQALNFYREGQATHFGQPLLGCQARAPLPQSHHPPLLLHPAFWGLSCTSHGAMEGSH